MWVWFAEHAEGLRQENEKLRASAAAHEAEAAERLAGGALSQQVRSADLAACRRLTGCQHRVHMGPCDNHRALALHR